MGAQSSAYACADDEYDCSIKTGIGSIGMCCKKGPPPVTVQRYDFCNIGPSIYPEKPSCQNCASVFSGDGGKADCLVRHQGDHVNSGNCKPEDCSTIR